MDAKELILTINNLTKSKRIDDYGGYAVKVNDLRGVAIVVDEDVVIDEHFQNVEIKNYVFQIDGELKKVIFLSTSDEFMSPKYGAICLDFLDLESREQIKKEPVKWFYEWRDLLGDSKKEKLIYDIVGEMAVLLKLQEAGKNPVWDSTKNGTFDISTNEAVYEIKSSRVKKDTYVTIHSQFQLDCSGLNKPLYITFVRIEDNDAGVSIDSLYNKLVENGFSKNILDDYLNSKGYYVGKNERYKEFVIHEIRLYLVDDEFPKITKNDFKNDKIPDNIVKFEYTISLDGLKYEILK